MPVKVGINGFGRIGRNVLRTALTDKNLEFVAVNDLTDPKTLAHLLKYDSILGNLPNTITAGADSISIDGKTIKVFKEKDPAAAALGERRRCKSSSNPPAASPTPTTPRSTCAASVKKVIISAPAKNEDVTIVLGVNEEKYDPAKHHIISNASCTTNCLAPVAKVIHDNFKIVSGIDDHDPLLYQRSGHPRLPAQGSAPGPRRRAQHDSHHDRRRQSDQTGACPNWPGKLDGFSMRVPTPDVSVVDLVVWVEKTTTKDEVNAALKKASESAH